MTGALVLRESLIAARKPALIATTIVTAGVLMFLPMAWGPRGLPLNDGTSIYEQMHLVEWIVLLAVLPWIAARIVAAEKANGLVEFCAVAGVAPSRVLLARLLALSGALILVVGGALPVVVIAHQMSAVTWVRLATDQASMIAFAFPVAVVTVWWTQWCESRLGAWLGAASMTAAALLSGRAVLGTTTAAVVVSVLASAAAAALLVSRADTWWRYLSDEPV